MPSSLSKQIAAKQAATAFGQPRPPPPLPPHPHKAHFEVRIPGPQRNGRGASRRKAAGREAIGIWQHAVYALLVGSMTVRDEQLRTSQSVGEG